MTPALSPLNFRGLLAQAGVTPHGGHETKPQQKKTRRQPIECWRCAECLTVYDWEDEAEECCADQVTAHSSSDCPVCGQSAASHQDAADCCLWKDMNKTDRYAAAEKVAAGATWIEALGINPLGMLS